MANFEQSKHSSSDEIDKFLDISPDDKLPDLDAFSQIHSSNIYDTANSVDIDVFSTIHQGTVVPLLKTEQYFDIDTIVALNPKMNEQRSDAADLQIANLDLDAGLTPQLELSNQQSNIASFDNLHFDINRDPSVDEATILNTPVINFDQPAEAMI